MCDGILPLFSLKFNPNYCDPNIALPAEVILFRHAILYNEHRAGTRDEPPKNVFVGVLSQTTTFFRKSPP